MILEPTEFLTFDDLTLLPGRHRGGPVSLNSHVSKHYRLPLPLLSAAMPTITEGAMAVAMGELGGLGVIHRFMEVERQCEIVAAVRSHTPDRDIFTDPCLADDTLLAAASVDPCDLPRARRRVAAGAGILFLDTSAPHGDEVFAGAARIRQAVDADLIIGSVVERTATRRYIDLGIDALKVGLGSGALCSMRRATGVGAPQVSALLEVAEVAAADGVPVISDGAARCGGDIVKALAVGASSVMVGSLLAGCDETPSEVIEVDGRRMKRVEGLRLGPLELETPTGYPQVDTYLEGREVPRVEGGDRLVPAIGPCHLALLRLIRGVRAGIRMAGASDIAELRAGARLVRVSPAGISEANVRA